jgi:hypothetical protein
VEQSFTLDLLYPYKGANCGYVRIKEDGGWIEVFNDFGEKMFAGGADDFVRFLNKLIYGEFS